MQRVRVKICGLRDPKQAFPPYDAILLVSPRAAKTPGVIEALRPLEEAVHKLAEAGLEGEVPVTVSLGVVGFVPGENSAQLGERAESALALAQR